jgi:hypothetical protein
LPSLDMADSDDDDASRSERSERSPVETTRNASREPSAPASTGPTGGGADQAHSSSEVEEVGTEGVASVVAPVVRGRGVSRGGARGKRGGGGAPVVRGGGGAPVVRARGKRGGGRSGKRGGPGGYKGTGRYKDGTPCKPKASVHDEDEGEDDDEEEEEEKESVPVESDGEEVRGSSSAAKPRNVRTPSNAEPVTTRRALGAGSKRDIHEEDDDIATTKPTKPAKRARVTDLDASSSAAPHIEALQSNPEIIIDRKMRDHFTCTFCNKVRKAFYLSACVFCSCACYTAALMQQIS